MGGTKGTSNGIERFDILAVAGEENLCSIFAVAAPDHLPMREANTKRLTGEGSSKEAELMRGRERGVGGQDSRGAAAQTKEEADDKWTARADSK